MQDLIPIQLLSPGQVARVGQLMGAAADVHRLEELGFRSGIVVEMVQPGSPCIVRLSGSKFCFRENDALSVLVHVGTSE